MKTNKLKKSFFFGLAALLAAGMSSCADESTDVGGAKPLDSDQSFFANITINSADGMTRAYGNYDPGDYDPDQNPNFDKGTTEENNIQSIYLIFYDEEGNRVSTTQVRKENSTKLPNRNESENDPLYSGVVQIDVKHGSLKPAYVMAFINPITATNFEINPDFATLTSLEKVTRDRIIDDNYNFAMSKSVYYGTNPVTKKEHERIMATPLTEGQLFTTVEKAKEALETDDPKNPVSVVDIYVERYAVKVNFSMEEVAKNASFDVDEDNQLTFVPEYWAVNAYESTTYVTKSFFETNNSEKVMGYDDLNIALGGDGDGAWKWNSETYHRCYWAQSPAYYASKYPRVADDILDKRTLLGQTGGYALGYYSYNNMKEMAQEKKLTSRARNLNDATEATRPIYARENTVSGEALQAAAKNTFASPKAAIGSVVLVGHYQLNGNEVGENEYFYVMGNATNGYTFFKSNDEMLNYFVRTTIAFARDAKGTPFFDYNTGAFLSGSTNTSYKKYFKIEHPQKDVRGDSDKESSLVIDSRFVTIQLAREEIDDNEPLYAYIDGEYQQVTQENLALVNQQMLYAAGTVQGFQGGKAYFTIPIKHLGYYRTNNPNINKNANAKNFDWTEVQSGDFGLVRNHIYSIVVDNITGLGNGIPNPDDPIVPPTDPEEYFIGARLIILNWAVVPTQHETL